MKEKFVLPGFTAEASLDRGKGQYYIGGIPSQGNVVAIQPAVRPFNPNPGCFDRCIADCYQYSDYCWAECNNACGRILVELFP